MKLYNVRTGETVEVEGLVGAIDFIQSKYRDKGDPKRNIVTEENTGTDTPGGVKSNSIYTELNSVSDSVNTGIPFVAMVRAEIMRRIAVYENSIRTLRMLNEEFNKDI